MGAAAVLVKAQRELVGGLRERPLAVAVGNGVFGQDVAPRAGAPAAHFAGLTEKLDYLEDLGVTALWLLPFYPSPGRDDGYDISDYRTINADFGTMSDFR